MTTEQQNKKQPETMEPVCSRFRLVSVVILSIGLGIATNRWMYANSSLSYTGKLQVKTTAVRAPVEGILQSWAAKEGEQVDPRALICKLTDDNLDRKIQSQQREVARLDARLKTLQAEVEVKLHNHLRELDGDIFATKLQYAELLKKEFDHKIEEEAWRDAHIQGKTISSEAKFVSQDPVINSLPVSSQSKNLTNVKIDTLLKEAAAVNAIEVATAQLEICSQRLEELQLQKKELLGKVKQANGLSEAEIQLNQAIAELEELKRRQLQQQVYSSDQGTIANFRHSPGEKVNAGEILADLYQMNKAYIVAEIPCTAMHNFELESTVKCLFPNGVKRTGVVTHVAITTQQASDGNLGNSPTVPVRIEQTGALWPSVPVGGRVSIIR